MKDTFKIGDLVELKSGGPVMTVLGTRKPLLNSVDADDEGTITCQWFSGKKLELGVFPQARLKPATQKG